MMMEPDNYKDIHTNCVNDVIQRLDKSSVLGEIPPANNRTYRTNPLPRRKNDTRAASYCKRLNDFKLKLGQIESAICPEYLFYCHTMGHLFECDAAPTNLSVIDIVIDFLKSLFFFNFLNPPELHPPPACLPNLILTKPSRIWPSTQHWLPGDTTTTTTTYCGHQLKIAQKKGYG